MLYTPSLRFRAAKALSSRLQPALLAPCASSAAYSTAARSHSIPQLLRQRQHLYSPSLRRTRLPLSSPTTIFKSRFASTATSASTTAPPNTTETLTWNRFLQLRKTRRRLSLIASIVSAVISTAGGIVFLSSREDMETWQPFGLDPFIVLGLSTMGFGVVGWLVGPIFGSAVFNMLYRRQREQFLLKERAFYARIKKYRADPSSSSVANPIPDYYGEKIGSVADYRRWLKDQRAFNLKRSGGVGSLKK